LGSLSDFLADDFTVQWLVKKIVDHLSLRAQVMGTSLQVSPFNTLLSLTPEHVPRHGWQIAAGR